MTFVKQRILKRRMIHERTVGKCDSIKIKNFCTSEDTIKTMKIHDRDWRKYV